MKRISQIFLVAVGIVLTFGGCAQFLDVNTDPNALSKVSLGSLLSVAELHHSQAHANVALTTSFWTQQQASIRANESDTQLPEGIDAAWSSLYLRSMMHGSRLITQAQESKAPTYEGIGKILMAANLGLASDTWENVPYTDAFKGAAGTIKYDSQQQCYQAITRLLDEGIAALGQAPGDSVPGVNDLYFKGDRAKWIRVANTLKARYALHLSAKGAQAAGQSALQTLQAANGIITSIGDGMEFDYSQAPVRNLNPIASRAAELVGGRIFVSLFSEFFINILKDDPRLPLMARTSADLVVTNYVGAPTGAGAGSGNAYITPRTWISSNPYQLVSYSEALLIRAEARFLAANGTPSTRGVSLEVYNDVVAGITANMTRMGISAADIKTYTDKLPKAADMRLSTIMLEKYKAMFMHPEVWTDMRRYGYSADVYTDFRLPQNHNPELGGRWLQRANYPLTERTRNAVSAPATTGGFFVNPMWRDSR